MPAGCAALFDLVEDRLLAKYGLLIECVLDRRSSFAVGDSLTLDDLLQVAPMEKEDERLDWRAKGRSSSGEMERCALTYPNTSACSMLPDCSLLACVCTVAKVQCKTQHGKGSTGHESPGMKSAGWSEERGDSYLVRQAFETDRLVTSNRSCILHWDKRLQRCCGCTNVHVRDLAYLRSDNFLIPDGVHA